MSMFIAVMLGSRFLADQNTIVQGEKNKEKKTTKKTEEKDKEKDKEKTG